MNLLRHILSHLLLFFILMALGLSYYFRPIIFPAPVNDKINALVKSVYPPALKVVYVSPRQKLIAEESAAQPTLKNDPVQIADAPASIIDNPARVEDAPVTQHAMAEAEKDVTPPAVVAEQQPVVEIEKPETVEMPVSKVQKFEKETAGMMTDREASAEKTLLVDARLAYLNKDLETAISKYRQLILLDEHNPNAFGEMGNIYYAQGKWQEAGAAYYEAAIRLVENGQMQQVAYLHRVIQGLDRNKADELAIKMNHGRM